MSTASQQSRVPTRKIRHADLIPPRGAKPVGIHADGSASGKIIYEMPVLDGVAMKAAKVVKRDPTTGEEVWEKAPDGTKLYPKLVLPAKGIFRNKRFVLVASDSLAVKMVENFEEQPQETAAREERKKVEAFTADLALDAVRRGFNNAAEMMASLFGDAEVQEGSELAEMIDDATDLADKD